jgi:hypothetical protein
MVSLPYYTDVDSTIEPSTSFLGVRKKSTVFLGATTAFSCSQRFFKMPAQQQTHALETTVHNLIFATTVKLAKIIYFEKFQAEAKV